MKRIKNVFTHSVGFGFLGLSCGHYCKYFHYNKDTKERKCVLYNLRLNNIFLNKDGYVRGEFFCNHYQDLSNNPYESAHPSGLEEFNKIKPQLEDYVLYEACQKEYLCMISFDEIEKIR
jgi:hypothetical protein